VASRAASEEHVDAAMLQPEDEWSPESVDDDSVMVTDAEPAASAESDTAPASATPPSAGGVVKVQNEFSHVAPSDWHLQSPSTVHHPSNPAGL
jgi:hypothetical protein